MPVTFKKGQSIKLDPRSSVKVSHKSGRGSSIWTITSAFQCLDWQEAGVRKQGQVSNPSILFWTQGSLLASEPQNKMLAPGLALSHTHICWIIHVCAICISEPRDRYCVLKSFPGKTRCCRSPLQEPVRLRLGISHHISSCKTGPVATFMPAHGRRVRNTIFCHFLANVIQKNVKNEIQGIYFHW